MTVQMAFIQFTYQGWYASGISNLRMFSGKETDIVNSQGEEEEEGEEIENDDDEVGDMEIDFENEEEEEEDEALQFDGQVDPLSLLDDNPEGFEQFQKLEYETMLSKRRRTNSKRFMFQLSNI